MTVPRSLTVILLSLCLSSLCCATEAPHSGRCGTFAILGTIPRPSLPSSFDSPSALFRIHYTTSGADAVPADDRNGNGIPDYVEAAAAALDSSYRCEVEVLGYVAPPRDAGRGGTDQFDVYLRDLSKVDQGFYGRTVPDSLISAASQPDRYMTFIEIDNNFDTADRGAGGQPIYATSGVAALQVTCAHEFHHAIQLGSYALSKVQPMVYELTSTWMEYRVFPTVRDNEQYVRAMLASPYGYPFGDPSASNGYHWWWFGNVTREAGGDALLRSVWERIATGARPFAALVAACDASGHPFADLFCSTMGSLYATGQRSTGNRFIPYADQLPSIYFHVDERAVPPSMMNAGTLRAFEVRAFRYTVPSTTADQPVVVGAMITNPDVAAMVASELTTRSYALLCAETNPGGATPIAGTDWTISVSPASTCLLVDGVQTSVVGGPYPQPFVRGIDDAVFLPVPYATQGDPATVRVYTMDMVTITEEQTQALIDGTRIAVSWVPTTLPVGVYLVGVTCLERTELYKVVIK